MHPDKAFDNLKTVISDFSAFVAGRGTTSEADTRAKVIDKVLVDVCGWPESAIAREDHVESGFIDYSLSVGNRRYVAVEAKKEGVSFEFPTTESKSLRLSGSILTNKPLSEAITQVRGYCDDAAIRYAIATNGYAWIVFRAIREDFPWRQGHARVFNSLEQVVDHFTEFWNLLSYEAVEKGALDDEFGSRLRKPRGLVRVLDGLYDGDLPLQRNRLHSQLHPIIQTIFEDIAEQDPVEILQSCYVHTESLRVGAADLNAVITDSIPTFLLDQGAEAIRQSEEDAGIFGSALSAAISDSNGQMYLLLGGIGSGKTTFIKRYQKVVGQPVLDKRAFWFHLDFLGAPLETSALEPFVWQQMLYQLRDRYMQLNLETRRNIKKAFAQEIQVLQQTAFQGQNSLPAGMFDKELSPYLEKWQSNTVDYVPRILNVAKHERKMQNVVFLDNVDQLSPTYQNQVFLLAQRITRTLGAITILALREESYYTANLQKTLTAYTSRKFHIASPRFRKMIDNRIRFALNILVHNRGPQDYVLPNGIQIDRKAIADFLQIIERSIFEQNHNISRFIEAICFGNMRLALDMFSMFMTSGATDVDKMLRIHRSGSKYSVPFHEFVKSIMLGERRYYKEEASFVMNLFDCGADRNSSHFTSLRIIDALQQRRGENTREGQGYVEVSRLVMGLEDVFDNREDSVRTLNRLLAKQLVEVNTRSTETISGASHVRVTSAGWYYRQFLIQSFSYLDLVLEDTPLDDPELEKELREYVAQVDNLSARDDQKVARMKVRFKRVRSFLQYLKAEEDREWNDFELTKRGEGWALRFVPEIQKQVEHEINWIKKRLEKHWYSRDISLEGSKKERGFSEVAWDDSGDEGSRIPVLKAVRASKGRKVFRPRRPQPRK